MAILEFVSFDFQPRFRGRRRCVGDDQTVGHAGRRQRSSVARPAREMEQVKMIAFSLKNLCSCNFQCMFITQDGIFVVD